MRIVLFDDDSKELVVSNPDKVSEKSCKDKELKDIYWAYHLYDYIAVNHEREQVESYPEYFGGVKAAPPPGGNVEENCEDAWHAIAVKRLGFPECIKDSGDTALISYVSNGRSESWANVHKCAGQDLTIGLFMLVYEAVNAGLKSFDIRKAAICVIPKDRGDGKTRPSFEFRTIRERHDGIRQAELEPISIYQGRRIVNMLAEEGTEVQIKLYTHFDDTYYDKSGI